MKTVQKIEYAYDSALETKRWGYSKEENILANRSDIAQVSSIASQVPKNQKIAILQRAKK